MTIGLLNACSTSNDQEQVGKLATQVDTIIAQPDSLVLNAETTVAKIQYGVKVSRQATPWKGEVVASSSWRDRNGENVLVISETEESLKGEVDVDMELFAYTYVNSGEGYRLLWQINDFRKYWGGDMNMDYVESSLEITDVDSNGVAESAFMYVSNEGSMSNNLVEECKLILHSDTVKMAIRGWVGYGTRDTVLIDPDKRKVFDAAFSDDNMRAYASKKWDNYAWICDSLNVILMLKQGVWKKEEIDQDLLKRMGLK